MPGPPKPPRKTLTVRLPEPVIARLKKVARDAAGMPCFATISGIVEAGLISECDRIEKILRASYSGDHANQLPARRTTTGERLVGVINNFSSGDA